MSAFAAAAVRNELGWIRLHAFVKELEAEVGPVDEEQVARFAAMFAEIEAANEAARGGAS